MQEKVKESAIRANKFERPQKKQIPGGKRESDGNRKSLRKQKTASANKKKIFKHSATFPSFDSFKCKSKRKWKEKNKPLLLKTLNLLTGK